jgi:ABC-type multidrug transport system fused ATPase/permease subunit
MDCADSAGMVLCCFSSIMLTHPQTGVALKRIAVFLDEEEVSDQVSSLKKDYSQPHLPGHSEGLGLDNATFKWNEVSESRETDQTKIIDSLPSSPPDSSHTTHTEANDTGSERSSSDAADRIFELKDVSVKFPEGELTIVTGPTASGKTALLVRILFVYSMRRF